MPLMNLSLAGQFYSARSLAAAAQVTINAYPELIQDPQERAKGAAWLTGRPGLLLAKTLTSIDPAATPFRGIWSGGGRVFVAAGTRYMELDSSYNLVGSTHAINDDANHTPVQIIPNGNQILIISAGLVYCDSGSGPTQIMFSTLTGTVNTSGTSVTWATGDLFDIGMVGTTITINGVGYAVLGVNAVSNKSLVLASSAGTQTGVTYADTPVLTAVTGAFLDGYFIVNRPNTRQFNWSALNDGLTWDPLDFGVKESNPDNLRAISVYDEQLYLWGLETMEVHQNTGQGIGGTPFQRIDGATQRYGSISAWGNIGIEGKVFLLGGSTDGDVSAYVLSGFTPQRISTHAEEAAWKAASLGINAISYSYREEGHTFWVINFGTQSWAYDTTTGAWHKRMAWSGAAYTPYQIAYHTYVPEFSNGIHLVGGPLSANLYVSSVYLFSDNGSDIAGERAVPYDYQNGGNRMYFGRMTLEMETGTVPSGAEPVINRDYSDDRGVSFVGSETAGYGLHNDASKRVFWIKGGSSRDRVWRFRWVGQNKIAMVNIEAEVEIGAS